METFSDIIDLWETRESFARDMGIEGGNARQMHLKDRMPAQYWLRLIAAAKRRGFKGVTAAKLTEIAGREA